MKRLHALAPAFCLLVLSSTARAQANFQPHAPYGASKLTADGLTVVGGAGSGAWLWSRPAGYVQLGGETAAELTDDARVVVGNRTGTTGYDGPARWSSDTGWIDLGGLPGHTPPGGSHGTAFDVSADGFVVVGLGWRSDFKARGFRWTRSSGVVELPQLGPNSSRASAISSDGQWIGGFDEHADGTRRAALWDASLGETLALVRAENPEGYGEINDLNSRGTVFVGIDNQFGQGYRWRSGEGVTLFGITPGFEDLPSYNFANATSEDGSVAVGGVWDLLGNTTYATLWTEATGQVVLSQYLTSLGVTGLDQYQLANSLDVSADGTTILGWGVEFPFTFIWWLATIPACEGGTASFCVTAANSVGSGARIDSNGQVSVAANAFELTAGPVPNQPGLFYFGSATEQTSFGNGFRCVGGGQPIFRLPIELAAGETLSHALDFGAAPADGNLLPGTTWHFQAWYRDPAAGGAAFNLSDGLSVTFCD